MSRRAELLKQIDLFLQEHPVGDDEGDRWRAPCDELDALLEQAAPIVEIRGLRFMTADGDPTLARALDWLGWPDPCQFDWPQEAEDEWCAQIGQFYRCHERTHLRVVK